MEKVSENLIRFTARLCKDALSVLRRKEGQTLVEYALLLMLIAMVVITAVSFVGQRTCNMYNNAATQLLNG